MTVVLALVVVASVALAVVVVLAFFDRDRHRNSSALLVARAKDLDAYREQSQAMLVAFTNAAIALSQRESDQMKLVLDAALADRERLVTALLAAGSNPQAARIVGMADQSKARVEREMGLRDFLEENIRTRVDSETMTADGQPIVPVGL